MNTVLVTGATGFIGNHVVSSLLKQGCRVTVTSANRDKAAKAPWFSSVQYIEFNMDSFDQHTDYYNFFSKPDSVIHLAWQGLPNYKSLFHFEYNLPLHYQFIKNLATHGCKDITITGTCFEYGMREGCLDESLPAAPANAYALAKDSLNKFLHELQKEHPFILKWVRLFYLYGPGQHANSLFSQLEKALASGEDNFNMSGGDQIRDYLPVERAADYLVKIALQQDAAGVINCCSGQPVTVRKLVDDYVKERGSAIRLNLGYYPYPDYEPMAFWGDNQKLQKILNEQ